MLAWKYSGLRHKGRKNTCAMRKCIVYLLSFFLPVTAYCQQDITSELPGLAAAEVPVNETLSLTWKADDNEIKAINEVYTLKPKVDIPVVAVGTIWTPYAFSKVYSKDPTPIEKIQALDKNNVNGLDRWAAGMNSESAEHTSDYIFYGSIPMPFLLLADREIRHDALKVGFMYWEAMAVTGLLYSGSTYFIDRFRPKTYNTDIPAQDRTNGNYRNAFPAGHVALVGTATFFAAKVYNDYHPDSKLKYVLWGGAIAATGTVAYLRHRAGMHFPTDILAGAAVGVFSGVLVPHFHKGRMFRNKSLSVTPTMVGNGYGFAAVYRFQ